MKYKLDKEEKKEKVIKAAKNTLKKLRKEDKITIRINHQDLKLIRYKTNYKVLPYQTLIGSILHKYTHK